MNPLGPLFPFELARVVRRHRPITARCLYVTALLVFLGVIYLSLFPHGPDSLYDYLFRSSADANQLAIFGFTFFSVFVMAQFTLGLLATAGSASSILAEEKEKQTLPFLLTTTMTDREIVFGKVGARVAQILMILLAGLPVLAIMQVMGGVDPGLLAAAFAATGVTLISAAGLGAAVSITANNVKQANGRAIGIIVAYLALGPMIGGWVMESFGSNRVLPDVLGGYTVAEAVDFFNSGNFFWAATQVVRTVAAGSRIDSVLWPILWRYVAFHGIIGAICITWSALRLRRILSRQADRAISKATKTASKLIARGGRRPVSQTMPVLWRETCTAVDKPSQRKINKWAKRIFFVISFIPLVGAIFEGVAMSGRGSNALAEAVHSVTRTLGTGVLIGAIINIISTAAGSIGRERRQSTLEELYLTDLSNREIINQKALGAVWASRWHMLWVAIHWLVDLIVGGLSPIALLIVPPLFAFYSFVAARIGMAFAVRESQKYKPTGVAVFSFLGICAWPAILILAHLLVIGPDDHIGKTALFAAGMSPPAALGMFTLGYDDLADVPIRMMDYVPIFLAGFLTGIVECILIARWARIQTFKRFSILRRE